MQFELQATREDLQTSIEELETSNEELKATNEEVMSMNEELQSTNEELETSREELQSLNEELSTVNSQLGEKVDQLERMNDDMSNLLTSTQIATIFLDTDLRIRFFTPAATDLLNIISADIDRPLSDLAPRVQDELLIADARAVLTDLRLSEREVRSDKRGVFIRRMRPYRTSSNRIEGVVVTYTDITRMVDARERLERRERQQAAVASLGGHARRCPIPRPVQGSRSQGARKPWGRFRQGPRVPSRQEGSHPMRRRGLGRPQNSELTDW
ncbi:MAG: PAS domain-containing protein [Bryobacterales bacterium]